MKIRTLLLLSSAAIVCTSQSYAQDAADSRPKPQSHKEKTSYIFGLNTGEMLQRQNIELDLKHLFLGIEDSLGAKPPRLAKSEIEETMHTLRQGMVVKLAKENQKQGEEYLARNKKREGVVTTKSGLQYEIVKAGNGPTPTASSKVAVHYKGTLIGGKEFDSSYRTGKPAKFPVTGVIPGWVEALQLMRKGAKWKLAIPPHLAYGANGAGRMIGPNATLLFEVELVDIL